MAKELTTIERNDQGRAIRRYFHSSEEELIQSVPEIAARYRQRTKSPDLAPQNNWFNAMLIRARK